MALQIAPGQLKTEELVNMKVNCLKVDEIIEKLGQAAIAGDVNECKPQIVLKTIDDVFAKIVSFIPSQDNGALLPAVQKVREAALNLVQGLGSFGDGSVFVALKQQKAA